MNWGTKIILAFAGFIAVIFTLAYISMGQDVNLVSKDYYVQELAYEEQIQRIRNTQSLEQKPTLVIDRKTYKAHLVFPASLKDKLDEGQVLFTGLPMVLLIKLSASLSMKTGCNHLMCPAM